MQSLVLVLVFTLALITPVIAEGASQCVVTVRTTMKNGEMKKRVFKTKALTEADCAEDAELHSTNFFPPKIAKVDSEYRFGNPGDAE